MGIRIEDSVCVGDDNPIVLSPEAVKEVCSSLFFSCRQCSVVGSNSLQVEDIEALRA
jgi:hypothetical protein